jgi:NADH:ubiquinone oxidoreductase subunit
LSSTRICKVRCSNGKDVFSEELVRARFVSKSQQVDKGNGKQIEVVEVSGDIIGKRCSGREHRVPNSCLRSLTQMNRERIGSSTKASFYPDPLVLCWLQFFDLHRSAGGTKTKLVGEDQSGNKYYEDPTRPYGRHRWVVYKDIRNYNASSVHVHWHAWLHCITDDTPVSKPPQAHKFDIEHVPNTSGTPQRYLPKGSWENAHQRNWLKVQFWTPPN